MKTELSFVVGDSELFINLASLDESQKAVIFDENKTPTEICNYCKQEKILTSTTAIDFRKISSDTVLEKIKDTIENFEKNP